MTAFLVLVETQLGAPAPQIWYADNGQFVGCQMKSLHKIELPERSVPWGVDEACRWAALEGKWPI